MIPEWQTRTGMLLGEAALERLAAARVVVVGVGGVGAMAAEMLVRAGVGHLTVIDSDSVNTTNINRQLLALNSTVGRSKVEVLSQRLLDINPGLDLHIEETYLTELNVESLIRKGECDHVVDAIDTISPKVALICHCLAAGIPLVSSMGSGAKLDATAVKVADISKTNMCPLAHMLRKRLHKMGIRSGFLAVFSEEKPLEGSIVLEESRNKKSQAGTVSYMPAVFGCVCAQAVICRIAEIREF
ncbi:MAG: tRNA threonylcarbamoyladenosine dehydratase [Bacteroidales bacterium]|nr:tRNA threonylcarbamoyladenosine dehydratase [Bacteroidales bacterium]